MHRFGGWLMPGLLIGAPAAMGQPIGYEDALRSAVGEQPALEAREAQIEARRESAEAADELPDPRLSAGIMNLPVTGPDAFNPTAQMMTMFQVGVEQEIPNLAKRNARTGIAEAEVSYARAQLTQAQYAAAIGAGQAWIALAFAQRRLTLADAALEELRELVPVARSAVASGSARPAQSLEIRRALLDLEDARTAIEAEREAAQARLTRYIFIKSPVASGTVPVPDIDPEHLRSTLERNPEILLAGAAVNRAEAATRLAESERRPDFGVSVNYGVRDRDYGDMFSVMGSVTLPLFAGRRQEPRIRAAEAEASAARAEREDQRRALAAQFESDLAMWRSAYRQWQRGRDELLPLARDRADLETASFAANRAGLTEVVEARKELALIGLEVLEREQAAAEAATRLRLTYREHMSW